MSTRCRKDSEHADCLLITVYCRPAAATSSTDSACCLQVYESGSVYDPKVLDITDADLSKTVTLGIQRIAAACLALNYPTLASIPHSVINGYKSVLAVSIETEYTFPLAQKVRQHQQIQTCLHVTHISSEAVLAATVLFHSHNLVKHACGLPAIK